MQEKPIICPQCGGVIPPGAPRCPFCGSAYAPEAEKEYMRKLHGVRQELGKVGNAGKEASEREAGTVGRKIAVTVCIIFAAAALIAGITLIVRSSENARDRREYHWSRENFPKWDALYEEGRYDELLELFDKALEEEHDLYDWEHYEFCYLYGDLLYAQYCRSRVMEGYFDADAAEELLYLELKLRGIPYRERLTDRDREILSGMLSPFEGDLTELFGMTEEEIRSFDASLEEKDGYPDSEQCRAYIMDHPEILRGGES